MKKIITYVVILLVLAGAGLSYYFYNRTQHFKKQIEDLLKNPQQLAAEETKKTVAEVGSIVALPADETPTVAVVNDPEKLKSNAFLSQAKAGDKLLIYTTAKRLYLYRPSEKRLVDATTININPASSPSPSPTK